MKLSNIFKKSELTKSVNKASNVQTLDKTQLEKVIGGVDEVTAAVTDTTNTTSVMGQKAKAWMVNN